MKKLTFTVSAFVIGAVAVACAPPKIMWDHSYASSDKSIITYIVQSGASVGSGKQQKNLYNVYMRVCTQDAANNMTNCKDSLVLDNVNPNSL